MKNEFWNQVSLNRQISNQGCVFHIFIPFKEADSDHQEKKRKVIAEPAESLVFCTAKTKLRKRYWRIF